MPASTAPDSDIRAAMAYLRSLAPSIPAESSTGNVAAGEENLLDVVRNLSSGERPRRPPGPRISRDRLEPCRSRLSARFANRARRSCRDIRQ